MKIGIFGGCFNPPHMMHEKVALELIDKKLLDKVIYVPTGDKYNKLGLVTEKDRYNMLKIICSKNEYLEVSDHEFNVERVYTYQTMDYFKKLYPKSELYFICGAENLDEFDTWREYKYIMSNYKILVNNRNNINIDNLLEKYDEFRNNIIITDVDFIDISSTMIRNMIKNSDGDIVKYLDLDVLDYIKENNLYI